MTSPGQTVPPIATRYSEAVSLTRVSVRFGTVTVLDSLSLTVPGGAITALTGSNGAGKSTVLGVLAGTVPIQSGTVTNGRGLAVSYVAQRSQVPDNLPITVRDTVAMGRWGSRGLWGRLRSEDRAIIAQCIEAMGLGGLEGRALGSLSGGQRQRALVAQGLARRAGLLLLDEPTVGLDSSARRMIEAAISAERDRGVAVVHATHDPDAIAAADHIVRLGRPEPDWS